jgi:hypothetical protein
LVLTFNRRSREIRKTFPANWTRLKSSLSIPRGASDYMASSNLLGNVAIFRTIAIKLVTS